MSYKKLNCKTCGYEHCHFRGSDREIPAYFCEDYKPADVANDDTIKDIVHNFGDQIKEEGE